MKKIKQSQLDDFAVIDLFSKETVKKDSFVFEVLDDHVLITNNDPYAQKKTEKVAKPSNPEIQHLFFGYTYDAGLDFPAAFETESNQYNRKSFLFNSGFIDNDINRRYISKKELEKVIADEKDNGREILLIKNITNTFILAYRRNLNTWLYEPFLYFCDGHFKFSDALKKIQEIKDINLVTEIEMDYDKGVKLKEVHSPASIIKLAQSITNNFYSRVEEVGDFTVLNIKPFSRQQDNSEPTPIYVAKKFGKITEQDMKFLQEHYQ